MKMSVSELLSSVKQSEEIAVQTMPAFTALFEPNPPPRLYTRKEAKELKYKPLTYPYIIPMEFSLLQEAVRQLETIPMLYVRPDMAKDEVELWRKGNQ